MTWAPVHVVEIGCGPAGSMVDVTAPGHVLTDQGNVVRSWGRHSSFSDFTGGTFSFTLDNRDGRYTPDNTNAGATPLSEGQAVAWSVSNGTITRLVSGKIAVGGGLQLIFPDGGVAESARIRVTVSDMLVEASRHSPSIPLAGSVVMGSSPYFYYALNEPAGSVQAVDSSLNALKPLTSLLASGYAFGAPGVPATGETQLALTNTDFGAIFDKTLVYPTGSLGFFNAWFTADVNGGIPAIVTGWPGIGLTIHPGIGNFGAIVTLGGTLQVLFTTPPLVPVFVAVGITYTQAGSNYTYTLSVYLNGTLFGTSTGAPTTTAPPTVFHSVDTGATAATVGSAMGHLSHTPTLIHEEFAGITTEPSRLQAIDASTPEITLGTLPTDLSTATVGADTATGQSTLDRLNDVARTEQGQLFTTTAGTVSVPVQTIGFRGRNRPTTITAMWTAKLDIQNDAQLVRDLSNTVSEIDATGVGVTAVATGVDLKSKVGSANASFNVLNNLYSDVFTAASDRLNRGRKTGLDVPSIVVDGMRVQTSDRSTDLLGLTLGDRHQIAGLPTAQLGYSTWDAFLIGVDEVYDGNTAKFTLWFEAASTSNNGAVWQNTTISGEGNRWMAGGVLSLSSSLTSGAASAQVATSDALTKFTTTAGHFPVDILIDSERITVTACTSATPQVMTITRGVGGTTAAAHSSGSNVELFTPTRWKY